MPWASIWPQNLIMPIKLHSLSREQIQKDKELPQLPQSFFHPDEEKEQLKQENRDLEAAIAALYKQNLLYLKMVNHCIASEKQALEDMESSVNFQTRANSKRRAIEERVRQDWDEFCHEMKFCRGSRVQKVIENVKEQIVAEGLEETGEILIAMA